MSMRNWQSYFRVACETIDGEQQTTVLTGPKGATVEAARKILGLIAKDYHVKPESIRVEPYIKTRDTYGFLHEIGYTDDRGRLVRIQNWYL